jgi:WD40 repeat protein
VYTLSSSWKCRLLLFTGGVDSKIRVYVRPPGGCFEHACLLLGHENWVRTLAVMLAAPVSHEGTLAQSACLWVASASQDRTIRLWTVAQEENQGGIKCQVRLESKTG